MTPSTTCFPVFLALADEGVAHPHPWLVEQIHHLTGLSDKELPGHVIMLLIAAVICVVGCKLLVGKPSVDKPSFGQQIVEIIVLQVRDMVEQATGTYGFKYLSYLLPLAALILTSNLMGLFPLFESPTANFNVTLALGLMTFIYYMFMGFAQQGLSYLKHFTGGLTAGLMAIMGGIIFVFEMFSNAIRPVTLALRLMINMFVDEQLGVAFGTIYKILLPVFPMLLGTFVAVVQTFIFVQLAIIYLSETVPHDGHGDEHAHA
ncbi:MAG: F0F1 ATP synthase subunit A [Chloracidobacterium sp.]|nr:F0F1 ATP synthase subunit A [Chloracidobacterium sp.]MDW8218401.1 FoF1 ATP synthase subunit a [Acidobacteriota bacterium]